jgi:tRNA G18 (ribose-2'-O)-methylase SpoU
VIPVDDPGDPRLDDYRRLNDPAARREIERAGGYFVVEGVLAIRALLASTYDVRSLLVTEARAADLAGALDGCEAPVYVAGRDVLASVAGFDIHRGAIAAADRRTLPDPGALLRDARRAVVVEDVNDHENLGALVRNAAAFGIDAVLLSPRCADPLYRRAVRVSIGHVLHVPHSRFTEWPGGLEVVARAGFERWALTPSGDVALATLPVPDRVALVVGAEGPGLTAAALARSDRRVRIEMAPGVDSLNVATATAIACWHVVR